MCARARERVYTKYINKNIEQPSKKWCFVGDDVTIVIDNEMPAKQRQMTVKCDANVLYRVFRMVVRCPILLLPSIPSILNTCTSVYV